MRENIATVEEGAKALPPQIFNGEKYIGVCNASTKIEMNLVTILH